MKLTVVYDAAADAELQRAVIRYEGERNLLGQEFLLPVIAAANKAAEQPQRFMVVKRSGELIARRALVKRFPYALVFMVSRNELRILAVAHSHRRPEYWRRRLS